MSVPLVATHRIDFPITVAGVTHHTRHYLKVVAGTGPSGFDGVLRDGATGIDVTALADDFYNAWSFFYGASDAVFGSPALEQIFGAAWLPLATLATTNVPTGGTPGIPAQQCTISMRDTGFHRVRSVLLENRFVLGQRTLPPSSGTTAALLAWYNGPVASNHLNGFNWIVGRSNLYLGSVISLVTDLNNKLRRRRNIA